MTIAAASSLRPVLEALVADYKNSYPEADIVTVYGSTGKLSAKIAAGGPYDLFLSASRRHVDSLTARGVSTAEPIHFADGSLVAWTADTTLPLHYVPELALPGQTGRRRYAIANPRTAPYGQATRSFLERIELWRALQPQLVYGESVGQSGQFVLSGAAEVGYVCQALPLSLPPDQRGKTVPVPTNLYSPIQNIALVLGDSPGAALFVGYLKSDAAGEVLREFGYLTE